MGRGNLVDHWSTIYSFFANSLHMWHNHNRSGGGVSHRVPFPGKMSKVKITRVIHIWNVGLWWLGVGEGEGVFLLAWCVWGGGGGLLYPCFGYIDDTRFNLLRPSNVIWPQRYWLTMAQNMAWCLTAPNHYLNQCWLQTMGIQIQFESEFPKIFMHLSADNESINFFTQFFLC